MQMRLSRRSNYDGSLLGSERFCFLVVEKSIEMCQNTTRSVLNDMVETIIWQKHKTLNIKSPGGTST